ncbi:DUF3102 domain-containing protein [Agrobacterium pusense]|uniref:DUF3102 domain-containing protein n=1 Tax=Agrobacterium pusense TaxID=648995 RepID=UPI000512F028|nr:DUF3102 domain-containing protein [Agrobacterium pusense]ANV22860.1 hypothetical protein BA939_02155 [Rhizobium sp. S41]KGE79982.1 hypothetical protein LW14_25825 [Rhizobium sp. H41]QWW75123.1 DUF3102 domain-containing protein [Agrobacterium pusense]
MTEGSNRLPHLLAEIKNANVVFAQAQKTTASAAFIMGKSLIEAKDLCGHGDWTGFLKEAGLPPRTAQRYMRLVQSGLGSEYIGLVGVTEALKEIDEAQEIMPSDGKAIMAVWEGESTPDTMMWWRIDRHTGGFFQAYTNDDDPDVATFLIVHSMPIVFIAFIVDVFSNGLMWDQPRQQRFRREVTMEERDEKIAFVKAEAARFQEARR